MTRTLELPDPETTTAGLQVQVTVTPAGTVTPSGLRISVLLPVGVTGKTEEILFETMRDEKGAEVVHIDEGGDPVAGVPLELRDAALALLEAAIGFRHMKGYAPAPPATLSVAGTGALPQVTTITPQATVAGDVSATAAPAKL